MPVTGAVQKFLYEFFWLLFERFIYINSVILGKSIYLLPVEPAEFHGAEHRGQSAVRYAHIHPDDLVRIQLLCIVGCLLLGKVNPLSTVHQFLENFRCI